MERLDHRCVNCFFVCPTLINVTYTVILTQTYVTLRNHMGTLIMSHSLLIITWASYCATYFLIQNIVHVKTDDCSTCSKCLRSDYMSLFYYWLYHDIVIYLECLVLNINGLLMSWILGICVGTPIVQ